MNFTELAKNQQPQKIYVPQSEEAFVKLDKLIYCRCGAATVFFIYYNEEWKRIRWKRCLIFRKGVLCFSKENGSKFSKTQ